LFANEDGSPLRLFHPWLGDASFRRRRPRTQILGKPGWVVKGPGRLSGRKLGRLLGPLCNSTTRNCIFPLDTTRALAQNPGNFSGSLRNHAPEKAVVNPGGTACSTCRDGRCSASTRSARPAATGCAPRSPARNSVATVVRLSTTYRRRWAPACGCAPAHSGATALPEVRGSRPSRADRVCSPPRQLP